MVRMNRNLQLRSSRGNENALGAPEPRWSRRLRVIILSIVAATVPCIQLEGGCGLSFAAQSEPKRQLHYDLIMSANDAICKPILGVYNRILAESITALRLSPTNAPLTSDFEVLHPEAFEAIGFRSPPLVEGKPGGGVYRADVFNDGDPRYVMLTDVIVPTVVIYANYNTSIGIIKRGVNPERWKLTDPGIFEKAHADLGGWISLEDRKYGVDYGYVLSKWPDLANALKEWPKDLPNYVSKALPIIFGPVSARMFTNGANTIIIANEYNDIRQGGRGIVIIYTVTPDEPVDVCYFLMTSGG